MLFVQTYIVFHSTDVDCGTLPAPKNGVVTITGTGVGYKAFYSCNTGFVLGGDDTRECLPDGTWSGRVPWCESMFVLNSHAPYSTHMSLENTRRLMGFI